MDIPGLAEEPFPVRTREATGSVNGIPTEITILDFADKILLTISQEGRLSQWIQVPLTGTSASTVEMTLPSSAGGLLPSTHLTPRTIFGGGGEERETMGQLCAAQLASHISLRSPEDRRMLVVGLGLKTISTEREAFFDLLELAQQVL